MDEERTDFYANAVSVMTTIYDMTLQFRTQSAVAIEKNKAPILEASALLNVRMSPQHAKSLAVLLTRHVIDYERQHGVTLPVPPELQQLWASLIHNQADSG